MHRTILTLAFALAASAALAQTAAITPHALDRFVGYYQWNEEVYHIRREGSRLYSEGTGQPVLPLTQVGPNLFRLLPGTYTFQQSVRGEVTSVLFVSPKGTIVWPRIGETRAKAIAAAQAAYLVRKSPQAGVQAILLRHILAIQEGKPLYGELAQPLSGSVRERFAEVQKGLAKYGRFKSLTYKSTLASGADTFSALYEHGRLEWVIAPPESDGKIHHLAFKNE
jgi:hypothetical protein